MKTIKSILCFATALLSLAGCGGGAENPLPPGDLYSPEGVLCHIDPRLQTADIVSANCGTPDRYIITCDRNATAPEPSCTFPQNSMAVTYDVVFCCGGAPVATAAAKP